MDIFIICITVSLAFIGKSVPAYKRQYGSKTKFKLISFHFSCLHRSFDPVRTLKLNTKCFKKIIILITLISPTTRPLQTHLSLPI